MKPTRSNVAHRLGEFPGIVFADDDAFTHRTRWRDVFRERIGAGFDGKVVFELGCFDASFLTRIAGRNPNTAFIGLDWKVKAIVDGATRVTEMGLKNVVLLRGRAQELGRIMGAGEASEMWLFHPDPCARPDELKNRLFAEPFLLDAHRALREGAALTLKTDHPGYYQWALALLGVERPAWFEVARQAHARGEKPPAFIGRLRAADLMSEAELPSPSEAAARCYEVSLHSVDFWKDSPAMAKSARRLFAGERTLFEEGFVQKRWPVYFLDLKRRGEGPVPRSIES